MMDAINSAMDTLLPIVATAIGSVITAVAAAAGARWAAKIKEETKGKKLARHIKTLDDTVADVVRGMNQKTVAALKEKAADGKLTKEEIDSISVDARLQISAIMGDGMDEIKSSFGDTDALIAAKIERAVGEAKRSCDTNGN